MLREIIETKIKDKETTLEKFIEVLKTKDDVKILKFIFNNNLRFSRCKVTKAKEGVNLKCPLEDKLYVEISNMAWQIVYFENYGIDEINGLKYIKMPFYLNGYDAKTLNPKKEIYLDGWIESLFQNHKLLKL